MTEEQKINTLGSLVHVTNLWSFIFNSNFRNNWVNDFNNAKLLGKSLSIMEAATTIMINMLLPIILLYLIYE